MPYYTTRATHSANPAAKHSDRLVLAVQRHQPLQLAGALPSRGLVLVEARVDPRRAPEEADAAVGAGAARHRRPRDDLRRVAQVPPQTIWPSAGLYRLGAHRAAPSQLASAPDPA